MSRGLAGALAGVVAVLLAGSAPAGVAERASPVAALAPVYPIPQTMRATGGLVHIPRVVRLITTPESDGAAASEVRRLLGLAGTARILGPRAPSSTALTVVVGRDERIERALHVTDSRGLLAGGYVLAVGRVGSAQVVVLDGVDRAGQYYAAQTLRQLLAGRRAVPSLVVRDWPAFPVRGVVEGFYGAPWPRASRLGLIDFLGRHKLNFFMYLPKDDPAVRKAWRTPLTDPALQQIESLERRARQDHVALNVGISPGDTICYTSQADFAALLSKLRSLWSAGVTSFTIALDDIDRKHAPCATDAAAFGGGDEGLARAQAHLINRIDDDFVAKHPGADRLIAVPTEYSGTSSSPYRRLLAQALRPDVRVQWTGPYGISTSISTTQAIDARRSYGHQLIIWDNYFVNDYLPGFLVLGPYAGRSPTLPRAVLGITANPMNEAEASKIGLFSVADFTWNSKAYDRSRSWDASLREFAGGDSRTTEALHAYASANFAPGVGIGQAPQLTAAMAVFWRAWDAGDASVGADLRRQFVQLRDAPALLRARLANPEFLAETQLWLDCTQLWAGAAVHAFDAMKAHRAGFPDLQAGEERQARALREQATLMVVPGTSPPATVHVGGNIIADFVHYALRGYGP